ncbi:hypothetical protein BJF79_46795 [Actinomadura sp. CNU-125]|nr:hypothetical protein BJF79_46795 [Actinomadura sp. CNU-125]
MLIIGGGPTGLSAAVFLARHGVPVTVVERRTDALGHPRARAINPRTVELFRDAGLEPEILSECSRVYDENSQLIRARSLPSPELRRTSMARPHSAAGTAGVSPCAWAPIDQDRLEILLREHARKLGADLRFGSRLLDFADFGGDGVDARIEDADGVHDVRADLLIAADGHRSGVREALGIGFTGPGALGSSANFVFTADLEAQLRGRNLGVGHFDLPRPGTVLLPHDGTGRWVLGIPYHPAAGESLDDFTPRRCAELAAAAVGARPADITIVPQLGDGTTVLGYEVEARVAERLRSGPVFLIGDAAHVMPPTGAFGASTGIQDAHNLAWKIAAVLAGRAGPGLLDTYEAERLPVARFTMEQALLQLRERTGRDVPLPADVRGRRRRRRLRPAVRLGRDRRRAGRRRPGDRLRAGGTCPGRPGTPRPATCGCRATAGRSPPSTCTAGARCCSPDRTAPRGRTP